MHKKKSLWERFCLFLVKCLLIIGLGLAAAIFIINAVNTYREETQPKPTAAATSAANGISLYSPPTEAPENGTTHAPTPEPTAVPTPKPEVHYDYLPVYDRVQTSEKKIAITVDDLSQAAVFQKLVEDAANEDYRLTLFPSGVAMENEYVGKLLRKCVTQFGYEVENRGYGSQKIYRLDDDRMAEQIWNMDIAVDAAMGGDYAMRYFRPFGAMGVKDQRTHNYLRQLGYTGIVTWTVNATMTSASALMDGLAPGNIYLFTSTEKDYNKMRTFIRFVQERGYEIVTLNELIGDEPNELEASNAMYLFATVAPVEGFEWVAENVATGDCSYRVYQIQKRLAELGYMSAEGADGSFGSGTASAVASFQVRCGLAGTGVCDEETQEKLFSTTASIANFVITATEGP